jgi:hypothetical protein
VFELAKDERLPEAVALSRRRGRRPNSDQIEGEIHAVADEYNTAVRDRVAAPIAHVEQRLRERGIYLSRRSIQRRLEAARSPERRLIDVED